MSGSSSVWYGGISTRFHARRIPSKSGSVSSSCRRSIGALVVAENNKSFKGQGNN